jgi:Fur family peroxide stress response transcriptional regulator
MKNDAAKNNGMDDTLARFKDLCRKAGLRITPQRVAVYEHLVGSKEHPSATMVYEQVRKQFPEVSLDTVNRTLATLAEMGLATVIPGSGDARRFDADLENHQHFRCLKCGKIIDFDCPEFENIKLPRQIRAKHKVLTKTLYLQGICEQCSSQDN